MTRKGIGAIPAIALSILLGACASPAVSPSSTEAPTTSSPEVPTTSSPEVSASAEPTTAELEKITLRFSFTASPVQIPQVYGVTSGIYEKHGFDVTVLESTGTPITLQVVGAGADHFGFADAAVYALSRAEGLPVRMLGVFAQESTADVVFYCDSGIESPADLRGKSLASPGSDAILQLLPGVLTQFDMTMDVINHVAVAPAARIAPVIERLVDAGVGYGYASTILYELAAEEAGEGEICTLRLSDYGIDTLGFGLFTSERMLEERAETVTRFSAAVQEAWSEAVANPEDAVDAMMELFPSANREQMERGFQVTIDATHTDASEGMPLGCVADEDAQRTIDILNQYQGLAERELAAELSVEDYFSNQFLPDCG
jgi:NitT/TauT family transport system substrate-binding protein